MDPAIAEAMEIDSPKASLGSPEPEEEEDPALDASIASLASDLHTLTLRGQHELYQQPRSTQNKLTSQTRALYKEYSRHGSMIRLSEQLRKFLTSPEIHSLDTNHIKVWTGEEVRMLNAMDLDTIIPSNTEYTFEELCSNTDATTTTPSGTQVSYNNDPESTMIVDETPFHPADMKIMFPQGLDMPDPFMQCINNILLLENCSAQAKLRHYRDKYCLPAPGAENGHPHALPLLRLGISSSVTSTLSSIFETAATHSLGLTPESRKLLRQAYDAQSGRVSDTEVTWLARSLRVDEEVVREWWEEEDLKRRGEKMMMVWCAARELERAKWYKDRGMH